MADLIAALTREAKINQAQLADRMGVKLQRVRDLASGRAGKLKREEADALIRNLHVRAEWLVTGQPPMFQNQQEKAATLLLDAIGDATQLVYALDLPAADAVHVRDLVYYVQSGAREGARRALGDLRRLPPDEQQLLDLYRATPERKRAALLALLGDDPAPSQTITAIGGNAAGRDVTVAVKPRRKM